MKDIIYKDANGKEYGDKDVVRIINPRQIALYWLNGLMPLDVYPSREYKDNKPIIVAMFDKEKSDALYEKWKNFELY